MAFDRVKQVYEVQNGVKHLLQIVRADYDYDGVVIEVQGRAISDVPVGPRAQLMRTLAAINIQGEKYRTFMSLFDVFYPANRGILETSLYSTIYEWHRYPVCKLYANTGKDCVDVGYPIQNLLSDMDDASLRLSTKADRIIVEDGVRSFWFNPADNTWVQSVPNRKSN